MDNRKWAANAIINPPAPPAAPSDGYPTNGDPLAPVLATKPGDYWFHAIGEELRAVIVEGGLAPNIGTLTQVRDAIRNMVKGGDYKDSVRFTTTANIALTGLGTQAGGDWPAALTAGARILPKNQTAGAENGIWIAAAGAWTRATDADTGAELNSGAIIPVEEGTVNADSNWQITNDGAVTIGVTGLTFSQLVGGLTQAAADLRYTGIGYMMVRDEKAQNTAGGNSTVGTSTRTLNTVSSNTIAGSSLASNQITLPAGTYRIKASAPAHNIDAHRAILYNVTDAVNIILGTAENGGAAIITRSTVNGRFTLVATKVLELRHYTATVGTNGYGEPVNNGGVEVYAEIEIIKES